MLPPKLNAQKEKLENKKKRSRSDNALLKELKALDMDSSPRSVEPAPGYCPCCGEMVRMEWTVCPSCNNDIPS